MPNVENSLESTPRVGGDSYNASLGSYDPLKGRVAGHDWNNLVWNDQMYHDMIASYKDELRPEDYQFLLNNPFLVSKQASFSPTIWQQFDYWGNHDRYYGEMKNNAVSWLDQKLEAFRQQKYDSASEQVQRENAAGMNPDLAPSMISAGSAAENDQPSDVMRPFTDAAAQGNEMVSTFSNAALQFVGSVMNMAKMFQDLHIGAEDRVVREIGANTAARDFYIQNLASHVTSNFDPSKYKSPDDLTDKEMENLLEPAIAEAKFPGFSRRARKYLERFGKSFKEDSLAVEAIREELKAKILQSKQEQVEIKASPAFDPSFDNWIVKYARKVSTIEYDLWRVQQRAMREHWNANRLGDEVTKITNGARKDLYDFVSNSNGGNHWYNTAGILALPLLGQGLGSVVSGASKFIPFVTKLIK